MSQISSTQNSKRNLYSLVLCAILIALSFVLGMVKIIPMPYGGSITLFSMLAATLTGYFCGPKWGLTSGVALGLLNLIIDPVILFPLQVILDYVLAFGCLGLSGFFSNKKMACISAMLSPFWEDSHVPSSRVSSSSVNTRRKA